MIEVTVLVAILVAGWFWVDSMRAREAAIDAGRRVCVAEGVQLLDWTVALAKLRVARDDDGRVGLKRTYEFEFSDTGDNRLKGSVTLLGTQLVTVNLTPREMLASNVVRLH